MHGVNLGDYDLIALTAAKYDSLEDTRCKIALRTAANFTEQNVPLVVMDGGSPDDVKAQLRLRKAVVVNAPRPGLATQYLDGIYFIRAHGGEFADVLKLEPEKDQMASGEVLQRIQRGLWNYETVVIGRTKKALDSLPPVQREVEARVGRLFEERYLMPADSLSGGRVWTPDAMEVWVPRYEDLLATFGARLNNWLYLYTSVIDVRNAGMMIGGIEVPLMHPSEIVAEETGNPVFDQKRHDQERVQVELMAEIYGESLEV